MDADVAESLSALSHSDSHRAQPRSSSCCLCFDQARHANWSSADDAAAVRRLAEDTAAADGRRRRVANGGCTAELIAEAQKK
eukprot:6173719-Pleurochrysis_carterae.AAC.1